VGSGRQYTSWIALDDAVAVIRFAIENPALEGPVNAVAPNPVTGAEFARTLGRVLGRPAVLPAPAFALRLAFGREMADEVLLASQRVVPRRLLDSGFVFRYPALENALRGV
jgi:NAD dependent epimerase/dehydratase family enzyme